MTSTGFQLPVLAEKPYQSSELFGTHTQAQNPPISTISSIGLGGNTAGFGTDQFGMVSMTGNYADAKPKEAALPPEMTLLVDQLKKHLKTNKELSDQIATSSVAEIKSIGGEIKDANLAISLVDLSARKLTSKTCALADRARNDLREIETIQRLQETIPTHSISVNQQPIRYLHDLNDAYSELVNSYMEQITNIESYVSARLNGESGGNGNERDLLVHLKRMDEIFQFVAARVYRIHANVQDAKDEVLDYRREMYGESASNPFLKSHESLSAKIEGPDPFSSPSHSVLINLAQMVGKSANTPTGAATFGGTSSLFTTKPATFTGFGSGSTSTARLFKPFSNSTTSHKSLGGVGDAVITTSQSVFNFGNTLTSSAGGTLFGGSVAKSFGK